jgi:hypothetical protein
MNKFKAALSTLLFLAMVVGLGAFLYLNIKAIISILCIIAILIWGWIIYIEFLDHFNQKK